MSRPEGTLDTQAGQHRLPFKDDGYIANTQTVPKTQVSRKTVGSLTSGCWNLSIVLCRSRSMAAVSSDPCHGLLSLTISRIICRPFHFLDHRILSLLPDGNIQRLLSHINHLDVSQHLLGYSVTWLY